LRIAKTEESFLQLSLSVHSDVYNKLCGKSRGDGRKFIIYTVRLISLRKNLNGVLKIVLEWTLRKEKKLFYYFPSLISQRKSSVGCQMFVCKKR